MAIAFPNTMRSIDDARRAIRFSGYDGMMEIRFSVDLDALDVLAGHVHSSDKAYLSTFDEMRARIQQVAARVQEKQIFAEQAGVQLILDRGFLVRAETE